MSIIPDIRPEFFSLSAVAVGYLLIDDATANEQNALGNWLMLAAQVLCTNAFYQQVQTERNNSPTNKYNNFNNSSWNSKSFPYEDYFSNSRKDLILLEKMVNALQREIEEIKKNL